MILRYAEVLLNKAEACYHLDQTADANAAIKAIRERVELPYTDKGGSALWDAIRQERKVELDNESFEEVFLLGLLGAALTSLAVTTFIIMIGLTVAGGSALADHVRPAVSAKDLGSEKVVGLGFRFCPGSVVVLEGSLDTIKKFFPDDRWNTSLDDHILVLVHTNVLSVLKDRP